MYPKTTPVERMVVEREVHRGHYNATNLQVDVELPPVGQLVDEARDMDWSAAASRGLDPDDARKNFPRFVESGARTVRTEVILTTFEELVESEFGQCIHEVRILEQRDRAAYSGRIAQNASSIMEYMLQLAISPTVQVEGLPIRVWGRYLRDTMVQALAELQNQERVEWLVPKEPGAKMEL